MNAQLLHLKAQELVTRYLKTEAELVEVLQKMDLHKTYRELGSPSLYAYATEKLGLPDGAAYNLITVARKAREVPALQAEIQNGSLTVSKARRIASVVTLENQDHWIGLAKTLPKAALEKEIARVAPQTLTPERAKYVTADRMRLELGVSEALMKKLKRVQDLVSQAGSKAATLEEALDAMTDLYLERRDPVVKAKRIALKSELKHPSKIELKIKSGLAQAPETQSTQKNELSVQNLRNSQVLKSNLPDQNLSNSKEPNTNFPVQNLSNLNLLKTEPTPQLGPGRVIPTKKLTLVTRRKSRPAELNHQIQLRDEGRCVEIDAQGNRCAQSRWTDIHHIIPVELGGKDTLENLVTLCRGHHQMIHAQLG